MRTAITTSHRAPEFVTSGRAPAGWLAAAAEEDRAGAVQVPEGFAADRLTAKLHAPTVSEGRIRELMNPSLGGVAIIIMDIGLVLEVLPVLEAFWELISIWRPHPMDSTIPSAFPRYPN